LSLKNGHLNEVELSVINFLKEYQGYEIQGKPDCLIRIWFTHHPREKISNFPKYFEESKSWGFFSIMTKVCNKRDPEREQYPLLNLMVYCE
jgi:hypothetical protein